MFGHSASGDMGVGVGGGVREWGGGGYLRIMGHHLFVVEGIEVGGKTGGCEGVLREFRTD